MDDDVGLLAGLERADPIGHADCLGAADRGEFERFVGAEPLRVDSAIACDPRRCCGGSQDVSHVTGVRCIASECNPSAALDDLGVPAYPGDTLAESQVRPRAIGDGSAGRQDQVDLVVIEPHPVGEHEMPAERPEMVEVHDRASTGAGEIALGVGRRGGEVHCHLGAELPSEIRRAGEQLVGCKVVPDQCDPSLHQSARRVGLDHAALTGQHFVVRRRERAGFDVPPPRADRAADTCRVHPRNHSIRVGDGAGLNERGDTVLERFDGAQGGRELIVVGGMFAVQWHRPAEDRDPWSE